MSYRLALLSINASVCGGGACDLSAAELAENEKHPNKLPFSGTLLILNTPSNKPPHGAEGHRIQVSTSVAKRRLKTIIGMALNYASDLSGHSVHRKVGVITGAWIEGDKFKVKGFIWKKDFPDAEADLKGGALGMSMELADVYVRSKSDEVWQLEDFHFSGATALYKTAAAYYQTALSAAAAALVRLEGGRMATKVKEKKAAGNGQGELLVKSIAAGVSSALDEALKPFISVLETQAKATSRMMASIDELKVVTIEAAKDDEEEKEEVVDVEAAEEEVAAADDEEAASDGEEEDAKKKKKAAEEDDDGDAEDDAELEAALENLEEDTAEEDEPGELNKDAEEQGSKTTRTGKVGKAKHMKELVKASSINASSMIRELYASNRATKKKLRTVEAKAAREKELMDNKLEALEAQVEQYAERVDRKTISPELTNFLAKNDVDIRNLQAEGKKMSVGFVDDMFASAPVTLDPTTRMWFKNQLLEAGIMEQGEIRR